MRDLTGQRILVVGASSGIGRAIAVDGAAAGASVAVSARRADMLGGIDAVAVPGDVRREQDCRRIVESAVGELGGLDALVYAVGSSVLRPMAAASQEDWRDVLETNVVGAAMVAAAAAPHLLASDGRAVFLSSKATRRPFPSLSLYTTSKFALDGLIACLPIEFPGLRVSRVVVGNTGGTDFSSSWDPVALGEAVDRWAAAGLMSDMGVMHPREVAEAVLFVLGAPGHVDDVAVLERPTDDGTYG
jgi:NAD(P)-dependent dehydrogenase (short-subunit alcohol dehydrogenase family)